MKHPSDRYSRRSAEAKALQQRQFRQRKINGAKRHRIVEIQEEETANEVRLAGENIIDG